MRMIFVGGFADGHVLDVPGGLRVYEVPQFLSEMGPARVVDLSSSVDAAATFRTHLYERCEINFISGETVSFMRPHDWTDEQAIKELVKGYRTP